MDNPVQCVRPVMAFSVFPTALSVLMIICLQMQADNAETLFGETAGPVVETSNGPVQGVYLDLTNAYFGIPYAVPPVGDGRWRAPAPAESWKPGVYRAVTPPPGCYQFCPDPLFACPRVVSEDCLYLTIFTPRSATNSSNFPVMLFIHGGSFVTGAGYLYNTDGRYDSGHSDVIVVLINYRLGVFGFLVTGDESEKATGNFGILDQRLALEWVQDNIASFGGDPNRVTLFGQSAGAQSVAIHLMSRRSENLFQRAVMESVPFSILFRSESQAVEKSSAVSDFLGCPRGDVLCMRSKSAAEVYEAQEKSAPTVTNDLFQLFEPWGPYVDGEDVTEQAVNAFVEGNFTKMPIIIGFVSDDARIFTFTAYTQPIVGIFAYRNAIRTFFPAHFLEILAQYPPYPPGSDQREALNVVFNHAIFQCPQRAAARGFAEHVGMSSWTYIYEHALSFNPYGQHWQFCVNHACHGDDLFTVFNSAQYGGYEFTAGENTLSRNMVYYWTNMAHTGNPNDNSWRNGTDIEDGAMTFEDVKYVEWPAHGNSTDGTYMRFMTPFGKISRGFLHKKCDFWDSLHFYI